LVAQPRASSASAGPPRRSCGGTNFTSNGDLGLLPTAAPFEAGCQLTLDVTLTPI